MSMIQHLFQFFNDTSVLEKIIVGIQGIALKYYTVCEKLNKACDKRDIIDTRYPNQLFLCYTIAD